jgi:hypothetical protein
MLRKYPSIQYLRQFRRLDQFLRKTVYWQEKLDGSNIGVSITRSGGLHLQSHNLLNANKEIYDKFNKIDNNVAIFRFLQTHPKLILFGELLAKGKSPTKLCTYDKTKFVVFDIWDTANMVWANPVEIERLLKDTAIETVNTLFVCRYQDKEHLLKDEAELVKYAERLGIEGLVGKVYGDFPEFFKVKWDIPKPKKNPKSDGPQLPELPESEIWGAIDKVMVDIGEEAFRDKKIVMPLIAKAVKEECKKHECQFSWRNLFQYYLTTLENLNKKT